MDDKELRLQCLRIASDTLKGYDAEQILTMAQKLYQWVAALPENEPVKKAA